MGTLGHLVFILTFGRLASLLFSCVEGVEVGAFVIVEAFGVLVDDVGCYFVQKGSVMGDDEKGAGVGLEIAGEEGDGGDVQHVGRFCDDVSMHSGNLSGATLPSRRSRSGSQKSALANASLILQPPEKVLVA